MDIFCFVEWRRRREKGEGNVRWEEEFRTTTTGTGRGGAEPKFVQGRNLWCSGHVWANPNPNAHARGPSHLGTLPLFPSLDYGYSYVWVKALPCSSFPTEGFGFGRVVWSVVWVGCFDWVFWSGGLVGWFGWVVWSGVLVGGYFLLLV